MKNKVVVYILVFTLFSCANSIPRKPIVRKTTSLMKESVSFNKSLNELEENKFKEIIKNDSLNTYNTSSNGFWYKFNNHNLTSYLPQRGDNLVYTYEVYDINNNIIYSKDEIGEQTYVVDKQEIIEGLRNGLKLMGEGDNVTFLFPSHKVFGYLGDQKKIGVNQPLIYKVQLNKINKQNESN